MSSLAPPRVNNAFVITRKLVGRLVLACAVLAALTLSACATSATPAPAVAVPPTACCTAGEVYSTLTQITPGNVRSLSGAWLDHLEGGSTTQAQESTPVAVDGRLYVQTGQGDVFAVNGATGHVIWEYRSGLAGTERGVAVAAGRVFAALGDEHVVALNEQTGALIWETQVGTAGQDTAANGSATPWTVYYNGLVYVGTENGGDVGMRGHLYALHAANGTVAWNFAGTAGPGQPGNSSWKGISWMLGGGDVWMAPTVDAQLGLMYVAVANPEPRVTGAPRAGDDLYTNSLVALNAATGKLVWYFQSVQHDLWDYDDTMTPLIGSVRYPSGTQQVVIYGSKTGWLYYLNAKTGKPALPVRQTAVPQLASQATSPTQPIPAGQSLVPTCPQRTGPTQPIPDYQSGCEFRPYLSSPVLVTPGGDGGANWALMSLDQKTGLLYVPVTEVDFAYSDGQPYGQPTFYEPAGEYRGGALDAVNPSTNKIAWQVTTPYGLSDGDGVLTTSAGLLFEGAPNGVLSARNPANGKVLWSWQTGTGIATTPVTYTVNGAQYVAIMAGGNDIYNSFGDSLWAFKLHGTVPPAKAPAAIPTRLPIDGVTTVAGDTVGDTVVMGRTWDAATGSPSAAEDLASQVAMAPSIMTVPAGTTVTFTNPSGNGMSHCAESFFDPASFKIGPLAPGHSGSYRFVKPGDYYYNDCAGFPWNTGEIIVQ
jgi:PQQ-dependent dehydrogenase (methanol/ethanol family)